MACLASNTSNINEKKMIEEPKINKMRSRNANSPSMGSDETNPIYKKSLAERNHLLTETSADTLSGEFNLVASEKYECETEQFIEYFLDFI